MTTPKTPVVFIHGLWLHATSWRPWTELFEEAGYEATAPGWPGVPDTVAEAREHPEQQAGKGIADAVGHYAQIVGSAKPIVIGHSFGGLVAQSLLGQDLAAAAVAIDPAPIKGVLVLPAGAAAGCLPRPGQAGEPEPVGLPDRCAIPLRVRQRAFGAGVGAASSYMTPGPSPRPAARCSRQRSLISPRIPRRR